MLSLLWFTVNSFVLTLCFELTGKFRFCIGKLFLSCCYCPTDTTLTPDKVRKIMQTKICQEAPTKIYELATKAL